VAPLAALLLFSAAFPLDPDPVRAVAPFEILPVKVAAPAGEARPVPQVAGEDIATAIPVPGLPFYASGSTCEFLDDYDEVCPFPGSTSPDVVYALPGWSAGWVDIRLCDSAYDTKVFVYENDASNLVACNDDECGMTGWQSLIDTMPLTGGNTYYVVVDGWGGGCGDYDLAITEVHVEIVACPSGALLEGEEDCHDDYDDQFNGGCNTLPEPVFGELPGTPDGSPFDICGTSGTFLYEGTQYRDTDWWEFRVTEPGPITFDCTAEFPLRIFVLDGREGCAGMQVLATATAGSVPDWATITWTFEPGVYWYWIGPDVFTNVICGADYASTITGLRSGAVSAPGTVSAATWGSVKTSYR